MDKLSRNYLFELWDAHASFRRDDDVQNAAYTQGRIDEYALQNALSGDDLETAHEEWILARAA